MLRSDTNSRKPSGSPFNRLQKLETALPAAVEVTFQSPIVEKIREKLENGSVSKPFVAKLLGLMSLADQSDQLKLSQTLLEWCLARMHRDLEATWLFLVYSDLLDPYSLLQHTSFLVLAQQFKEDKAPLSKITSELMEKILAHKCIMTTEIEMFKLLKDWSSATPEPDGKHTPENRLAIAIQFCKKYIKLEKISGYDRWTTVMSSGLASADQYMFPKDSHLTWRGPRWNNHDSNIMNRTTPKKTTMETLHCHSMKAGVHVWSLSVQKDAATVAMGLAIKYTTPGVTKLLGILDLRNDGTCNLVQEGQPQELCRNLPWYGYGSVLQFTLDLTGSGILSVKLDFDTHHHVLHDNVWLIGCEVEMEQALAGGKPFLPDECKHNRAFWPTAAVSPGGAICFRGFEQVPTAVAYGKKISRSASNLSTYSSRRSITSEEEKKEAHARNLAKTYSFGGVSLEASSQIDVRDTGLKVKRRGSLTTSNTKKEESKEHKDMKDGSFNKDEGKCDIQDIFGQRLKNENEVSTQSMSNTTDFEFCPSIDLSMMKTLQTLGDEDSVQTIDLSKGDSLSRTGSITSRAKSKESMDSMGIPLFDDSGLINYEHDLQDHHDNPTENKEDPYSHLENVDYFNSERD